MVVTIWGFEISQQYVTCSSITTRSTAKDHVCFKHASLLETKCYSVKWIVCTHPPLKAFDTFGAPILGIFLVCAR